MNENDSREFWALNNKLYYTLKSFLDESTEQEVKEPWGQLSVWSGVLDNLENINIYYKKKKDVVGYAESQIGLAKYFDFYSMRWMEKNQIGKINDLIDSIVYLAENIISAARLPQRLFCGRHEDGACVAKPLGSRFTLASVNSIKGPPCLPYRDAVNFKKCPQRIKLPVGTVLHRVIGKNNNPYGCWWFKDNLLPSDIIEWRSGFEVLKLWNSGKYMVSFVLGDELSVWEGGAASQRVPKERCVLEGGKEQVWLDPSEIDITKVSKRRFSRF